MHTVIIMARIAVIVSTATATSVMGTDLHQWLDKEVHSPFTGHGEKTTPQAIDENLAYTHTH